MSATKAKPRNRSFADVLRNLEDMPRVSMETSQEGCSITRITRGKSEHIILEVRRAS